MFKYHDNPKYAVQSTCVSIFPGVDAARHTYTGTGKREWTIYTGEFTLFLSVVSVSGMFQHAKRAREIIRSKHVDLNTEYEVTYYGGDNPFIGLRPKGTQ